MMGGIGAHEYMAPCPAGENDVALAAGWAANVEIASAEAQPVSLPPPLDEPALVETPGMTTVEAVSRALEVPEGALLKAFPVIVDHDDRGDRGAGDARDGGASDARDGRMKLVVVRGDHRVNEHKLRNALGSDFRPAHPDEVAERLGPPGFIGPVDAEVPILLDAAVVPGGNAAGGYVTGANRPDTHLRGVEPGRDFRFEPVDVRTVLPGDTVNGSAIRIERAIEVGNIFKLGTRYSEPLGARYLDESGKEQLIWMGSYGFGPARAAAAAVEQYADEQGISWPRAIAPFDLELVVLGKQGGEERELAERLYGELREAGLDVLYDDRDAGPGEKFADAELLGCPARVTVGRRTLSEGTVEVQIRRGRESRVVPIDGAAEAIARLWQELP
jgi:prolyl-tRNA synthetase